MKYKYRIAELVNGNFMVQWKTSGILSLIDKWENCALPDNGTTYQQAEDYFNELLKEQKSLQKKINEKKIKKIVKVSDKT